MRLKLGLLLVLLLLFSANCFAFTYTKSSSDNTLTADYSNSFFVSKNPTTTYWQPTGQLDWNSSLGNSWKDPNLSGYFLMNSKNGSTITDTASGYTMTLNGSANIVSGGLWDSNALTLDGSSYVESSNSLDFAYDYYDDFSLDVWVKPTYPGGAVVSKSENIWCEGPGYQFWAGDAYSDGTIAVGFWMRKYACGGETIAVHLDERIPASAWTHIVTTYDGSASASGIKIYINGIESPTTIDADSWWGDSIQVSVPLRLGQSEGDGGGSFFSGKIDEAKIWNKALTAEEVEKEYNNPKNAKFAMTPINAGRSLLWTGFRANTDSNYNFGTPLCLGTDMALTECEQDGLDLNLSEGLVGLWHLDNNANDSSGNGNNGSWGGSEAYANGLWDTNAGSFDGTSDYIVALDDDLPSGSSSRTISFWLKSSVKNAYGGVLQYATSNETQDVTFYTEASQAVAGRIHFNSYGPSDLLSTVDVCDGSWHNVVGVYDGSTGYLYIDGILDVTGAQTFNTTPNGELNIGRADLGFWAYFNGSIDDVAIWNRALSETEVSNMFKKGSSRMDLNIYTCSDANCNTKTATQNIPFAKNNYLYNPNDLGLGNSQYFGAEAFFLPANGNYSTPVSNAFLSGVVVTGINPISPGNIRTADDSNSPRSYFGLGNTVRILYDTLNTNPLQVTITDQNSAVKKNLQNMALFSTDGNVKTYYYDYILDGNKGWYLVTITDTNTTGSESFQKVFYRGEVWGSKNENDDNFTFPFSFDLNVTEPNTANRWFYPVDVPIDFNGKTAAVSSIRVVYFNDANYIEVPSQLYDINYVSGKAANARLAFLVSIAQGETKRFTINYSSVDENKTYATDLNASRLGREITVTNGYYSAVTDMNKGGASTLLSANAGSTNNLGTESSGVSFQESPESRFGRTIDSIVDIPDASYSIQSGPVVSIVKVSSSATSFDYNIAYKFYSKNPFFFADLNGTITLLNKPGYSFYDSLLYLDNSLFDSLVYKDSSENLVSVAMSSSTYSSTDTNYYGLFASPNSKGTGDAFGEMFLTRNSTGLTITSPTLSMIDESDGLSATRTIYSGTIHGGDSFNTRIARGTFNPWNSYADLNNYYNSYSSDLIYSFGVVTVNDSIAPTVDSNYYLPADANDLLDLNCYANWHDNIMIGTIDTNIWGPNLSVFTTTTVNATDYNISYRIPASALNSGNVYCKFTAHDLGGNNTDSNTMLKFVSDNTAPEIISVTNTPDTNALIDPDTNIVIDANINEYTSVHTVTLFYQQYNDVNAIWPVDWNSALMSNDLNYSDTNYHYISSFVAGEGTWRYYIDANDSSGLTSNNSTKTIYSYLDYTWTFDSNITPADTNNASLLPHSSANSDLNLGYITLTNTGDAELSFILSSNWSDSTKIFFDGTAQNGGYVITLDSNDDNPLNSSASILVAVTTPTTSIARLDYLTIQAIASDTSALPSTATFDTIVRTEVGGPFLYLQWITTNDSAKQGDTNVTYSIKVTNLGSDFNGANPAATNVTFDWNIPAKWTALGELRSWQTSLAKNAYVTKLLSVNIASDATLGTQTVLFTSGCNNDNNKTQQSTTTTIITDALGNTGDGVTPPSGPGTGGPGGGGSGGGGASPFTGTQKDVFFQTSEFFELVRGEDNSFSIKFTNPLDNNLTNLTLEVNGLLSNYLKLKDTKITKLDSNEEFTTSIEITSPKYFSPGEYELTFTINGTYGKTQFKEERKVILLIHDTNKTQAKSYLTEMKLFIEELTQSNLKTTQIPELLKDANALFNTRDYDGVKDKYSEAKIIFDSAIDAMNKTQNISGLIGISSAKGINTPNTNRLFTLAQLALQRGDYALALSRLKEAELTYSLETKGEFNMFVWILGNLDRVALMLILFIIATFMFIKGITLLTINMKLKNLNSENNLLLNLITALQIKTFSENNTSLGEYYDALTQFENRIAEVSEGIIEMMSKRNNTLNFAPQTTRLTQEKKSLLKLIKDTQKQYFDLGLVETRIYKTKLNSLTKRLSEVEEQIVTNDLKKTIRTQGKGITKHAWRTYYKLFK